MNYIFRLDSQDKSVLGQWRNAAPATPATPGGATLRGRQKGALYQRKVAPRFFLEFYDLSLKITPHWCIPLSNLALSRCEQIFWGPFFAQGAQKSCRGAPKKVPDLFFFFRDTKNLGDFFEPPGGAKLNQPVPLTLRHCYCQCSVISYYLNITLKFM